MHSNMIATEMKNSMIAILYIIQNHTARQFMLIFSMITVRNSSIDGKCKLAWNVIKKLPSALWLASYMKIIILRN